MILSQNIEGVSEVPSVITGVHRLCYHIVDVHLHGTTDLLFEDLVHQMLIGGARILQTKRHNLVVVQPTVGNKGRIILIGLVHWNLVVPGESIYETKHLMSRHSIDQLVYPRKREAILRAGLV